MLGILTATSKTSFWPPLSVVKALRMGGSWSVSNLTVIDVSYDSCDALGIASDGAPLPRQM